MIAMTLADIAGVVDGRVEGAGDAAEGRVTAPASLDSRDIEPGGLFVALTGEHVDGHDFAEAAGDAGAAAVLGSRATALPTVVVGDVIGALGLLARHVRDRCGATVLALTGSQGKTGTKDYLAGVLGALGPTVATQGNLNNELGVPLTVLRVREETAYLVVEMGARGPGHVARLCEVARPDASAVLNVGTAHLGEFGSRAAIARAKGEIVEALDERGTAVLALHDAMVAPMARRTRGRVLTFGPASLGAEVSWADVTLDDLARPHFVLAHAGASYAVALRQVGRHQVPNAVAAAALAVAAGAPLDTVAEGLRTAEIASRWRMEVSERFDGTVVLNDAYNANPESVEAALDALDAIGAARGARRVAVLGDMLELGEDEEAAHAAVGHAVVTAGVDVLVAVGRLSAHTAAAAAASDGWQGDALVLAGREEATAWVRQNVRAGDVVLVKASRGGALEHVAEALTGGEEDGPR